MIVTSTSRSRGLIRSSEGMGAFSARSADNSKGNRTDSSLFIVRGVERWGQPAIPALSVLKLQPKNHAVDYNSRMAIFRPGSQPAQGMRAQKSKLLLSSGVSALIIVLCYLLYGHIENTGWFGWALREFIFVLASLSLLVTILSLIGFFSRSAKTR